jgi:mannosyl-oligosaccharide alpha-1,2-mannosidase
MLGGLLSAYHSSGGRIVVHGVQKEMATYKDQILMFYLDDAKDLRDRLMVAFTSSPSHVPFFRCDFSRMECTNN